MRGLLLLASIVAYAAPAQAQDARSAEAFIRSIYSVEDPQPGRAFWDADATRMVATPSLAALRQRDLDAEKATQDPSDLNFGPLCGCQDDEGMHLVGVVIRQVQPGRAAAAVTLGFTFGQATLRMDLVAIGRAWRIDNIHGRSGPYPWNLRTVLKRSITAHSPGAH